MLKSRREFAKTLAGGTALLLNGSGCRGLPSSEKNPLLGIQPSRYFDLAHRADIAIDALTNLLHKRQAYLPYFDVHFHAQPPVAVHNRWDYGDCTGRYIDAIRLARIMRGQTQGQEIEAALQKLSESLLGEHGLSWWPDPPYKPRLRLDAPRRVAEMTWTQRGALLGLTTQYAVTGERRFRDLAERLIEGLNKVALWRDGMAYFPVDSTEVGSLADILYPPEGWATDRMPTAGWFGGFMGALIWPLARFATLTGYEPAQRMASGVAVVRFELPKQDQSVHLGYDTYEVQYQGDTVTAISPPAKVCPLYERQWVLSPSPEIPDPTPARASEIDSI